MADAAGREGCRMKLLIQIPCYNEARTLETALNDLPKKLKALMRSKYLIVNDGSLMIRWKWQGNGACIIS